MDRIRSFVALTLALLIAVTSQQMALARGMTHTVAGEVIICSGQGMITVQLDADGNPVEPAHICPDCALSLMVAVATPAAQPVTDIHMQTLAQTPVLQWQTVFIHSDANARAPPVFV